MLRVYCSEYYGKNMPPSSVNSVKGMNQPVTSDNLICLSDLLFREQLILLRARYQVCLSLRVKIFPRYEGNSGWYPWDNFQHFRDVKNNIKGYFILE